MSSVKGLVNGAAQLVILQFSFSKLSLIPNCIPMRAPESKEKTTERKNAVRGEQIIPETAGVKVLGFLQSLIPYGYQLSDAFALTREKNGQEYGVVRFVFAGPGHHMASAEFAKNRPAYLEELRKLLDEACWRVRAFINPFFRDQLPVDDKYVISINLEARDPLVNPDGSLILRWKRDENNNKIGDQKFPIEPKNFLKIRNGEVVIVANVVLANV